MEQRPWLMNYPSGVPANIDADSYPNLLVFFEETFKKYQKKTAFVCMDKGLTFQTIDKMSSQFAAYLHSRGLEPGDKIALMMPNLLQYPIALFGALRAGLIVVNTNPLYTPREMKHQFIDSGVKAILIAENFAANLEKILAETSIKVVITTSIGELLGFFKGGIVNFVVRRIKKMVPKYEIPNTVKFSEAISQGSRFKIKEFTSKPEDTIILQYTGGTTGVSKGAMLTHRNLVANLLQVQAIMNPFLNKEGATILCPLPLYHIYAFTVNCLALMSMGARNILITNPRDLGTLISAFKKYPIDLMTGLNTLFNALLNHKEFAGLDFSHLKITSAGGMALQQSVAERWQEVTGCQISEGYGMTETSPVACSNYPGGHARIGTIGLPVPSTDMRIVDEEGNVLPPNEVGEIQIKGPQVMKGYYNRPDETAKCLKDGWISTGDIGLMEDDGYFKIVDRKKDMILVSGFNVFPNEIEAVIAAHPKVLEVAAIGVPDEKSTEAVKVFIVKKDNSLTEGEIKEYCKENLTGYKRPRHIEFRDELPKTNIGKILRRALKE
ncbi:MAG: AMP-binding protein [Saprospiraceae bacterium]|nr:AMP-binding protein [Saprospiraceae bacterium]